MNKRVSQESLYFWIFFIVLNSVLVGASLAHIDRASVS